MQFSEMHEAVSVDAFLSINSFTKKLIFIFFSIWVFFHEHSQFAGQQGTGEASSLTPLYHSHPLHRHLHISLPITVKNSLLHLATDPNRDPLVSECKSLTTKLHQYRGKMMLWTLFKLIWRVNGKGLHCACFSGQACKDIY